MNPSRPEVLAFFKRTYWEEYDALGDEGIAVLLDRGARWRLQDVLSGGGALVFPHVHIADCGPYVAAVVDACLASGADQILGIGVLHAWTEDMVAARKLPFSEMEGHPLRQVYGEGLEGPVDCWRDDHSMVCFVRMLGDGARLRGVKMPKLILRYPFLVGESPETLPGLPELAEVARDSVIVSTADHCHHGIGYGHSREEAIYFDDAGLAVVRKMIEEGLAMLGESKLAAYLEHCRGVTKSDWVDAGPVLHHLLGPLKSEVVAVVPSDFSQSIYQSPAPTWCAGALVTLKAAVGRKDGVGRSPSWDPFEGYTYNA
jgi:hypothetical protein